MKKVVLGLAILSSLALVGCTSENNAKSNESTTNSSEITKESTETSEEKKEREEKEAKEKAEQEAAQKKADEEAAKKKTEQEAAQKKADEEAAKKKAEQEKAKAASLTKSGSGDDVTDALSLDEGYTVFEVTNSGDSNFAVKLHDENGGSDLLINEIGAYNGKVGTLIKTAGNYNLEVTSSGNWTIKASQVIPTSGAKNEISGHGDDVQFMEIEAGNYRVTGTHNGASNFAVKADDSSLLFNEIGNYKGTIMQKVNDTSIYAISVVADGDWTIKFEK